MSKKGVKVYTSITKTVLYFLAFSVPFLILVSHWLITFCYSLRIKSYKRLIKGFSGCTYWFFFNTQAGVFKEFLALLLVISCAHGRVYERPRATVDADPDVIAYTSDEQEDEEKVDVEDYSLPKFSDQKRENNKQHRVFWTYTERNDDRRSQQTTGEIWGEICSSLNTLSTQVISNIRELACSKRYIKICCWSPRTRECNLCTNYAIIENALG